MAENIERLPNYTCLETIERSVRLPDKKKLLFRDRIHLDVAFIGTNEMFAWPGSDHFAADLLQQLPRQAGAAVAIGGFGGWVGSLFGRSAPAFTYDGACLVENRRGSRYIFSVPLLSSGYQIMVGERSATSAYAGSICIDADESDVMMLEVHAEEIAVPVAAASETIRYGRTRVGSGDFLLPRDDELTMTDLHGNENHNLTRFSACRQYTSQSSISFDTVHEGAPVQQEKAAEIELPAGISLDLELETPITYEASAIGDPIAARLTRPIHAAGVSIPKGATVSGRIRGLEEYYEPEKYFSVSLEFSSLAFGGQRARFSARLIGPRLEPQAGEPPGHAPPSSGSGRWSGNSGAAAPPHAAAAAGFDIDASAPRFGVFRVNGGSLRLNRGLRMIWQTQGGIE
ncbi:MAG TPA: hypothetical protein VGE89_12225 [Bryobacteraceae bacterium]|jgi:hypothetical protein